MDSRTRQRVDESVKEHAKTEISRDKLVDKLMDNHGVSRDDAESRVMALIRQGTLFEPEPGKVRMLRA
jgi:hypothetical protein